MLLAKINDLYAKGYYVWQIADILGISEVQVIKALGIYY